VNRVAFFFNVKSNIVAHLLDVLKLIH